jgi:putative transposase
MIKFCLLWLNLFADLLCLLVLGFRSKGSLAAENLFLRKQLAFYKERRIRPRRTSHPARLTLLWLSRWFNWRGALTVVTPKTFIGWHRKGFQLFWRRKCQSDRPRIPLDLQRLIHKMAGENPSWGEERIANELLLKLGLRVSPRTIRKYLPKLPAAPGGSPRRDQRWSTFLKNHADAMIACDFCVVASATFGLFTCLWSWNMRHAELFTSTCLPIRPQPGPSNSCVKLSLQTTRTVLSSMTATRSSPPDWMLR